MVFHSGNPIDSTKNYAFLGIKRQDYLILQVMSQKDLKGVSGQLMLLQLTSVSVCSMFKVNVSVSEMT